MIVAVFSKKELDFVIREREYYQFDTGMTTAYTQDFKNLADKDSFFPDFKQDEMDIFIANKNRRRED